LLHLSMWSQNAVRELTREMMQANEEAVTSMQHVMQHCIETPNCGLLLAPTGVCTGIEKLVIKGMSDTTYTSDYD
jgi:hypothetical protein